LSVAKVILQTAHFLSHLQRSAYESAMDVQFWLSSWALLNDLWLEWKNFYCWLLTTPQQMMELASSA
jgi:hypothetical protein